jgi:hypothetical protein
MVCWLRFLNRLDLGLKRVKPCDCARDADQINCLLSRLTSVLMAARSSAQRLFRSSFKIHGRTAPPMLAGLQSASK